MPNQINATNFWILLPWVLGGHQEVTIVEFSEAP